MAAWKRANSVMRGTVRRRDPHDHHLPGHGAGVALGGSGAVGVDDDGGQPAGVGDVVVVGVGPAADERGVAGVLDRPPAGLVVHGAVLAVLADAARAAALIEGAASEL